MRRVVPALSFVISAFLGRAAPAVAQDDGPKAGTWGAEASPGGSASLLRFRSAKYASVLGVSAYYYRSVTESGLPGEEETNDLLSLQFRGGFRAYRETESRTRPFWTLLGIVGYDNRDNGGGATFMFGAGTELGASYFFSPHVSMGASAALSATHRGAEAGNLRSEVTVSFEGLRLLGAVYF